MITFAQKYPNSMALVFQNPITINGNVFFASDFHLGSPNERESKEREHKIIDWLNEIKNEVTHLFLLGDIFDFWFEYKDVVPAGYYNFLSKLSKLRARGVKIYYFTGNHDMWVRTYFERELGFKIFREQQAFMINGKRCLVAHGDGLGPKDIGYKFIKTIFAFRPNQKLYACLHPTWAFAIARFCSKKSRAMTSTAEEKFMGNEKEFLVQYALSVLKNESIDFFIYAHRHLPLEIQLNEGSKYFNTGDWLIHDSFVAFKESDKKPYLCSLK
ncbi:MAG: UDP-2,3-diacylglucosamine diphosphatase [Bacteroidales bacterium]